MLWNVLLAVVCGLVGLLLARLVVRAPKVQRIRFTIVAVATLGVLYVLGRERVLPPVRAWQVRADARRFLDHDPVWAVILAQHPGFRDQFLETMASLGRDGASARSVADKRRELTRIALAGDFPRYAGQASPAALAAYVAAMVSALDHLRQRDPQVCYQFLYGAGFEEAKGIAELPVGLQEQMLASMADVVASGARDPQPVPDPSQGEGLVRSLVQRLSSTHDEKFMETFAQLANLAAATADHGDLCTVSLEMYRELSNMAEPDRSTLLRYTFTKKQ